MKVRFVKKQPLTADVASFWLKPEKPVRYMAGQFIELKIPHEDADGRGVKRWFTLSSSPTDSLLSITTRIIKERSSFKNALNGLKPGSQLDMVSPMGDFVLPKDKTIPLFFVAGGIGCTPYHSMIKYLSDTGEKRDIQMLYMAHSADEVVFRDLFESYPGDNFEVTIGRLDANTILKKAKDPQRRLIYLSGPEPMIEALEAGIKKAGFNADHLRTDFFPGYTKL